MSIDTSVVISVSMQLRYLSTQGYVVDALKEWRERLPLPRGSKIVKNILIDMGVAQRDKLTEVYEVKTSADRDSLYKGIGQLMVHGKETACRKVIVLPRDGRIPPDVKAALKIHSIETILFSIEGESVTIDN